MKLSGYLGIWNTWLTSVRFITGCRNASNLMSFSVGWRCFWSGWRKIKPGLPGGRWRKNYLPSRLGSTVRMRVRSGRPVRLRKRLKDCLKWWIWSFRPIFMLWSRLPRHSNNWFSRSNRGKSLLDKVLRAFFVPTYCSTPARLRR